MQYCTPITQFRMAIIIKTAVTMVLCSQSSVLSLFSSTELNIVNSTSKDMQYVIARCHQAIITRFIIQLPLKAYG